MTSAGAAGSLSSMTGFARASGAWRGEAWAWEVKSVNGKALDVRFRLPAGCEALESPARGLVTDRLKRGNVQAGLTLASGTTENAPRVNEALLNELVKTAAELRAKTRGVLEFPEHDLSEADAKQRDSALLKGLEQAVAGLVQSRLAEGAKLHAVLKSQLSRIEELAVAATESPARAIDQQKRRLAEAVAKLLDASSTLDPQRLHQEAVLLQTKADVQEELDRLFAHIATAKTLLSAREPAGRKLDFLMQEFNREANTLCSKSPDASLTAIGLDLKTVIDQMREQVQNIE
jgi:uncharacterized protein (TIGR00255 family)